MARDTSLSVSWRVGTLAILLVVLSLFGTVSALEYPLLDNNVSAASNYTDFNNSTIAQ